MGLFLVHFVYYSFDLFFWESFGSHEVFQVFYLSVSFEHLFGYWTDFVEFLSIHAFLGEVPPPSVARVHELRVDLAKYSSQSLFPLFDVRHSGFIAHEVHSQFGFVSLSQNGYHIQSSPAFKNAGGQFLGFVE